MFSNKHVKSASFEWKVEGNNFKRELVVETDLETDPTTDGFDSGELDDLIDNIMETNKERSLDINSVRIRGVRKR